MEEKQAIARLKCEDLGGLEVLVRMYYFKAVRTAYLIVHDRALAEDIVQNAFLRASKKIDQLAADRFGPWFLRIVVNASLKTMARQKRFVSLNSGDEGAVPSLEDILVDLQPSPEEIIEAEEMRQAIWQALTKLSPEQRAAVVMKYFLELSETEISKELERPRSTIKWWLYAGRKQLRDLLRPLHFDAQTSSERQNGRPGNREQEFDDER